MYDIASITYPSNEPLHCYTHNWCNAGLWLMGSYKQTQHNLLLSKPFSFCRMACCYGLKLQHSSSFSKPMQMSHTSPQLQLQMRLMATKAEAQQAADAAYPFRALTSGVQ